MFPFDVRSNAPAVVGKSPLVVPPVIQVPPGVNRHVANQLGTRAAEIADDEVACGLRLRRGRRLRSGGGLIARSRS